DADAFLRTISGPFAFLHPGSARAETAWGAELYADLAHRIEGDLGLKPILSWGPGDETRVERPATLSQKSVPRPPLDPPSLPHVIARGTVFVAGDTGPVHLADALGRPTLALFGPHSGPRNVPERNRPYRGRAFRLGEGTGATEVAEELQSVVRHSAIA